MAELYDEIIQEQIRRFGISNRAASSRLNRLLDAAAGMAAAECITEYNETMDYDFLCTAKILLSNMKAFKRKSGLVRVVLHGENAKSIRCVMLDAIVEELGCDGSQAVDKMIDGIMWCASNRDEEYQRRWEKRKTKKSTKERQRCETV